VDFGSRPVLPFYSRPQHQSPFSARSQSFRSRLLLPRRPSTPGVLSDSIPRRRFFRGVWISVPAADFSLLLVFSLAGFISLCGARFALLFFAVVTLQVQQRLLLLVLSALATQFAFGSLSHCSAACSRFLHPCLLLYSIFASTAVSQDCLVSASCCSARFRLQVKILIAWIVAG
jgi:hypothetical protein